MPGVIVTTATRSGPAAAGAPAAATFFLSGLAERGPARSAVRVGSLAEYRTVFGERVSYGFLYDQLQTYFEEGGASAVVARVVGPAATASSVAVPDRASVPVNTLRFDAANPGAWGARLSVRVTAGSGSAFTVAVLFDGIEVEAFPEFTAPSQVPAVVATSAWVRATDLGSVTAAPGNSPAAGTYALTGGNDDRAAVTAGDLVTALGRFTDEFGTGILAVPGYPSSAVGTGLMSAARSGHRTFLTAVAPGSTPAQAIAAADAVSTAGNPVGGEYGALVYPAVRLPGNRTITPEGYVAAARARAIIGAGGPWQAPAGERAIARYVLGTDFQVDRATGDNLDANRVSAIRTFGGTTRLYGWRSLSRDVQNYALLTGRDVLNLVHREAESALEPYVFATMDSSGRVLAQVQATLVGLLEPMADAGAFYAATTVDGEPVDPGYLVDVGPGVNTPQSLASNTIRATVGIRISPVATLIELTITKVAVTAAL